MKKIKIDPNIFRPYDIRGAEESYVKSQKIEKNSLLSKSAHAAILNPESAYVIGRSIADLFTPSSLVIGYDSRLTSPDLYQATIKGLIDGGVKVTKIGVSTSDLVYFAIGKHQFNMGIVITGSHTIKYLNGMKICRLTDKSVTPLFKGNGLEKIKKYCLKQEFKQSKHKGKVIEKNYYSEYADFILSLFPDCKSYSYQNVILDAGNGTAGIVYKKILDELNIKSQYLNFKPDGNFPAHDPDPAVFENMAPLVKKMKAADADFGVAWDGDADRVAFITKRGEILTGSHIGSMLLPWVANKYPKSPVIITPPMTKAFLELANHFEMPVVYAKVGTSYVKEAMDKNSSPFGAEEADHFMFRESYGTESGIIPLMILLDRLNETGKTFDRLLLEAKRCYHISGDLNFEFKDSRKVLNSIEEFFRKNNDLLLIDKLDGLRMEFTKWRFCIRPSSYDPVVRLNLETESDKDLADKAEDMRRIIHEIH